MFNQISSCAWPYKYYLSELRDPCNFDDIWEYEKSNCLPRLSRHGYGASSFPFFYPYSYSFPLYFALLAAPGQRLSSLAILFASVGVSTITTSPRLSSILSLFCKHVTSSHSHMKLTNLFFDFLSLEKKLLLKSAIWNVLLEYPF